MRKHIVLMTLALALPTAATLAHADGPREGHKGPGSKLIRMTKELGLSADQQARIKVILEEEHKKKDALKTETEGKLTGVLTKEQRAQWERRQK